MSPADHSLSCPHCGARLLAMALPDGVQYDETHHYVCFNDDCSYYREGWDWMMEQYSQKASYRYMINPTTGAASPLPVWSDQATREMIVEDDEGEPE